MRELNRYQALVCSEHSGEGSREDDCTWVLQSYDELPGSLIFGKLPRRSNQARASLLTCMLFPFRHTPFLRVQSLHENGHKKVGYSTIEMAFRRTGYDIPTPT